MERSRDITGYHGKRGDVGDFGQSKLHRIEQVMSASACSEYIVKNLAGFRVQTYREFIFPLATSGYYQISYKMFVYRYIYIYHI